MMTSLEKNVFHLRNSKLATAFVVRANVRKTKNMMNSEMARVRENIGCVGKFRVVDGLLMA